MSTVTGFIVRLSPERQDVFNNRLDHTTFAEPVNEFTYSHYVPLVCFIVDIADQITHIAIGKRGRFAGTNMRRLNLSKIFGLHSDVYIGLIYDAAPPQVKKHLREKLQQGGLLPPKSFEAMIQRLTELAPETAAILNKYSEARRIRIESLPERTKQVLAEQKDVVATALSIADIDRDNLLGWDVDEKKPTTSFLDGLEQVRLREDTMVFNDFMHLPGYDVIRTTPHTSAVFRNSQSTLTVILANRQPLEELLGTDLIYYNETFSCFIMIQYKAMEQEGEETIFRLPDLQLSKEIERMNTILDELKKCPANNQADGYRLSENPFFLKFCPRTVFDPDDISLIKGMYIPLDYWKLLSEHPALTGPKGGRLLSYKNARRYFDNTAFIAIAGDGWVGTTIGQSDVLRAAIRSTLESGRAVVFAVKSAKGSGQLSQET